jgi:hypothetical protein
MSRRNPIIGLPRSIETRPFEPQRRRILLDAMRYKYDRLRVAAFIFFLTCLLAVATMFQLLRLAL